MPPTLSNGKICYIEPPATDIARSSEFFKRVFGWNCRKRSDGAAAFDYGAGEMRGTWVRGRAPASPGLLIYIVVESRATALASVVAEGGEIV